MKILHNVEEKSNTVILEKFLFSIDSAQTVLKFSEDLQSTLEVIGGVYYQDCNDQQIFIELRNNSLLTLLATLESIALRIPLHIMYDDTVAPVELFAKLFNVPVWLAKTMRFLGLIKHRYTYADLIAYAKSSPRVLKTIRQPDGSTRLADR